MTSPSIARRKPLTARIGIFGVGFHAYWPQFDGLLEELLAKQKTLVQRVQSHGVEVIDFGMVDDAEAAYALLIVTIVGAGLTDRLMQCQLKRCRAFFFGDPRAQWCSETCGSYYRVYKNRNGATKAKRLLV